VATVAYSAQAIDDLDRLFDFLASANPSAALNAGEVIVDAVRILERHPYIGRPIRGPLRELVISYGRTGYVALYRVAPRADQVEVLAIRHQREAGYRP
jgi:plasmid stabilization system protein ParE